MGERKAHWRVGGVGGVGELEELAKGIVRWTFFGEIGIGDPGLRWKGRRCWLF